MLNPDFEITKPQTNIIFITFESKEVAKKIVKLANKEGILTWALKNRIRLVTHYGITAEDAIEGGKQLGAIIRKNV